MTSNLSERESEIKQEAQLRQRKHALSLAISAAKPGEPGETTVARAIIFEAYLSEQISERDNLRITGAHNVQEKAR